MAASGEHVDYSDVINHSGVFWTAADAEGHVMTNI